MFYENIVAEYCPSFALTQKTFSCWYGFIHTACDKEEEVRNFYL